MLSFAKTKEGSPGIGFVICDNCGFYEQMSNDKRIIIFETKKTSPSALDKEAVGVEKLYQYKRMKCRNKPCKSEEVIVWRDNEFNVQYVCVLCHELVKTGFAIPET